MHVKLGQILYKKYIMTKKKKTQLPLLKSWSKNNRWEQKRSAVHAPCTQLGPWLHPYPHPIEGTSSPSSGSK